MARVQIDLHVSRSSSDIVDALAVAQGGLNVYLGSVQWRPTNGDSVRINLSGGYADVVVHVVQKPVDTLSNWTYVVRSTGRLITPILGPEPQAIRTVAQFAEWQQGGIRTVAALTAINGVAGATASPLLINGNDQCQAGSIAGLRAPGNTGAFEGASGSPATNVQGSWSEVAAEAGIDWQAVTQGGFVADHGGTVLSDTNFASYLIEGNAYLWDVSGTGLLIVTGELDTEGAFFAWDGVILVGGKFDPDAAYTHIRGIVVSGLNKQLGLGVAKNLFDNPLHIQYDSCTIQRSLQSLSGFIPIQNAWIDNWATY